MINPLKMDSSDKQFMVASVAVPIIIWWVFTGRKKYGVRGMK